MNTLKIKGKWNAAAGKIKQKFAKLTNDNFLFEEGREEESLGIHQQELGKIKEEIRMLLDKI